jgi:hypothetical protein
MGSDGYSGLERGDDACAACGKRLTEEPASFAALSPEADGFKRRDYCVACFETLPARPFSFWKRAPQAHARADGKGGEKEERKAARRRDLDALVELFERLDPAHPERSAVGDGAAPKEARPEAEKLRYLLALALVRKKRLHLVELARAGGADCLVLKTSGEAELVTVPAPRLSKEDLDRLARELEQEVGLS